MRTEGAALRTVRLERPQDSSGRTETIVTRLKTWIRKQKYALAAFFLPVLITVLAFAVTGIYPFGENQITVIDMYHQYVPFLSELQYKLHHGGSLFYSWHGAGGFNFWNLLSYYGASPLNLLLFFFPGSLFLANFWTRLKKPDGL